MSDRKLGFFERYLSLWVLACMVAGPALGRVAPGLVDQVSRFEIGRDSHVNAAIAVLITLFVDWLVKPFSMALLGWLFIQYLFSQTLHWIDPETAKGYVAGLIIFAAALCTAMVFVWSHLTDGDASYTLAQVAINDIIIVFAFAPIVMLLVGVSGVIIPVGVLIGSVVVFIVIPLVAGWTSRELMIRARGIEWFERRFQPPFRPVIIVALLATLALIFAFQAKNILTNWTAVLLLAIPILIQVYFNSGITYALMRFFGVRPNVATPGALIGASNFFELAVVVAITLFGATSPAALATVVGVLVGVPVMLSVCRICVVTKPWFERTGPAQAHALSINS